jgi:kinetochore protein Spc25
LLRSGTNTHEFVFLDDRPDCRFRFTELDPNDPSREFSFLLDADLDEAYDIQECDPPLDPRTQESISERFNESDDMSEFIRGMRRAFQDTL